MECYTSKAKLLVLLGLTCVMVGVSYFVATLPDVDLFHRAICWIGVGFFGLGFIAFPVMFFRTGPQIVLNDEGIEDRRMKIGVIRWEDIHALSIVSVHSSKLLCIELTEPQKYLPRLPRWKRLLAATNEALGFSSITISFAGLTPGIKEVWAYLQDRTKN